MMTPEHVLNVVIDSPVTRKAGKQEDLWTLQKVEWGHAHRSVDLIASIDNDGVVTVEDGHTVSEMLPYLFPDGDLLPYRYFLTPGMLKSALGVTWNTRQTREFWDAVRDLLIERDGVIS